MFKLKAWPHIMAMGFPKIGARHPVPIPLRESQVFNSTTVMPKREDIENLGRKYGFTNPFKPDPLVIRANKYAQLGQAVLDVGCGEGADSVYFAKKGHRVDAVDTNKDYLGRLMAYLRDNAISNVTVYNCDVIGYHYPQDHYDVINCLLVGCCMKRSEFEKMLVSLKRSLKPNGVMIMSLRNYLDPQLAEYSITETPIESNTYIKKDDCCEIRYFIEEGRLGEVFEDFDTLYYYEGMFPDKYLEVPEHGDSYIISRKRSGKQEDFR